MRQGRSWRDAARAAWVAVPFPAGCLAQLQPQPSVPSQVYVKQQACAGGPGGAVQVAKMTLVDLAGSERASVANTRGERLREGASINRSLLALIGVITALAGAKGKSSHIPYRDSKLTRLLKDCIGGNCRTLMLAALSPSPLAYEDTYNTLKYASRAKDIKVSLKSNLASVDGHVCKYTELCEQLRAEVAELRAKLRAYEDAARGIRCQGPALLPALPSSPLKLPRPAAPARSISPGQQPLHRDGSFLAQDAAPEALEAVVQQEAAASQEQVPAAGRAAELSGASPARRSQQGCDGQDPAEASVALPAAPVTSSPLPGWQHLARLTGGTLLALSPIRKRGRSVEMAAPSQLASPCSLSPRLKRQRRSGQQAEAASAAQSLDSPCLPAAAPAPPGSLPPPACTSSLCLGPVTESPVPLSGAEGGCALPVPSGHHLDAAYETCKAVAPARTQELNVTYEVCRLSASASGPGPLDCSVTEGPALEQSQRLLDKQDDAPSVPKTCKQAHNRETPSMPKLVVSRASALKQKAEERAASPRLGGHRSRIPQPRSGRQRAAKSSACQPRKVLGAL